jgi:aspartyl-tRNA(Asn)/glutamyl-tRNA(Gln) amidotransferase subunit A
LLAAGRGLGATDLFEAQRLQRVLAADLALGFGQHDFILTPACAAMPWPARETHPSSIDGRSVDARGHAVFTAFVNGAGLPAISLPAEPTESGLPVGFQLVGAHGSDMVLCALGLAFEQRHPWRQRRPRPLLESLES